MSEKKQIRDCGCIVARVISIDAIKATFELQYVDSANGQRPILGEHLVIPLPPLVKEDD